jgi:carbon monoxide dehydrogenase subunit G
MAEAETETTIARPADEVWATVADFGGLAAWMPGIESCRLEGDDRMLVMGGMEIVERLYRRDDDARVLMYGIVGGPVPVEHHQGTITVEPDGDGCRVTWAVQVEPDSMTDLFVQTYQQGLEALKAHAEA